MSKAFQSPAAAVPINMCSGMLPDGSGGTTSSSSPVSTSGSSIGDLYIPSELGANKSLFRHTPASAKARELVDTDRCARTCSTIGHHVVKPSGCPAVLVHDPKRVRSYNSCCCCQPSVSSQFAYPCNLYLCFNCLLQKHHADEIAQR